MHIDNAAALLAKVMDWKEDDVASHLPFLQLLAEYKYDHYQRFAPGRRFIESLALWLNQFSIADRAIALEFVVKRLVYISDGELSHLVRTAYPDMIVQEQIRLVAEEFDVPLHKIGKIVRMPRFGELQRKSLYLGLSDGARTNELRRASNGEINNEQIWQAYELSDEKIEDMLKELKSSLDDVEQDPRFNIIWLLDDFSGSGNTYIRYDNKSQSYKGKIKKIYESLVRGDLVDPSHYDVFLLIYCATRQAIDHIEYWAERFTSEKGYKPLQVRVLFTLESEVSLRADSDASIHSFLSKPEYYDVAASDKHIEVGGTKDAQLGFAGCALPVVLSHNTPNNSVYVLWGPETMSTFGLFPRVSRHREF